MRKRRKRENVKKKEERERGLKLEDGRRRYNDFGFYFLLLVFIVYILLTKTLYCKVVIFTEMPYISESSVFMDSTYL